MIYILIPDTIKENRTVDGIGSDSYLSFISGLRHSQYYFVRAYATNSAGTSYGNQVKVVIFPNGSNIDNNRNK